MQFYANQDNFIKRESDTTQRWVIYHSDAESGKLYKYFCFKTSLLLGTTGVRARSEFAVHGKN
ncbi:hypothetical protein FUT84_07850 [Treponema phagedenis]|uniref:Uncharacterized protein n=1 Tax=Treponema phagedenis TaxID=162 RepID=A0AAE6ITT0_TREPH|nr:hypothetical protein FUT79_08005 [Treponema phagedenis]QEJ98182.1 hypothetical protein FUT82_09335 [Treponema phagedenis]QEK01071.1 hypothetical protein FUT84_07850 [Treponema phagedenis]QEK03689.1 hypothetical protein FUT83_07640 [Treponema phagedenis]QEK06079.1 hypothetical protein FUT80_04745 [Treponema phagedenis]